MSKLQECRQLHIFLSHVFLTSRCLSKPFLTMIQRRTRRSHVRRRGCLSKRETFFRFWAKMMWLGGRRNTKAMPTPELAWFPPSTSRNGELLAQHGDFSSNDFSFPAEYHSSTVMIKWASNPACESVFPWVWIWSTVLSNSWLMAKSSMTVLGPPRLLWNKQALAHLVSECGLQGEHIVISGKESNLKTWEVSDLVHLNRLPCIPSRASLWILYFGAVLTLNLCWKLIGPLTFSFPRRLALRRPEIIVQPLKLSNRKSCKFVNKNAWKPDLTVGFWLLKQVLQGGALGGGSY